jgi:hypothetical protein
MFYGIPPGGISSVPHQPPIFNRADLRVHLDLGAQVVFLPPQTAFVIVGEQDHGMDIMPMPFLPIFEGSFNRC